MKVKFAKVHPEAKLPSYAKAGDAGLDLTAVSCEYDESTETINYDTGLIVEIPDGHVGYLFSRSSIVKTSLMLANGTGIIDSNYRGTLSAKFRVGVGTNVNLYKVGDRVCQLVIMPIPKIEIEDVSVDELSKTERGDGGWGSSGA